MRALFVGTLLICASSAFAQESASLGNRMSAITSALEEEQAKQDAQERTRLAEQRRRHAEVEAERQRRQRLAEEAAVRRERLEAQERATRAAAQAEAQRKRDSREDQIWQLELEQRKARLEMDKAKAVHAHEYVARELKRQDAETDVIKSGADATRNLSEGTKSLLEDTGKAKVKKETGLFNR
jgi:hypothetical protein